MSDDDKTDFNDLQREEGLDEVARQVMPVLRALEAKSGVVVSAEAQLPPPEVKELEALSLEAALFRFSLTYPESEVYDSEKNCIVRRSVLKDLLGPDLYKEWNTSKHRKVVEHGVAQESVHHFQYQGDGELAWMLNKLTLLYPDEVAWDADAKKLVIIRNLNLHYKANWDAWLKHPMRRSIPRENLVFDPSESVDPKTHINKFDGWPLEPVNNYEAASPVLQLIHHLCGPEDAAFDFLMQWLAYPLKYPGAKMKTAVLMHSDVQGAGKSLLADGVMRQIYGKYSTTVGQHQMEGAYNDWLVDQLFCVFEEIFNRKNKFDHTGPLKQLITGEKQRIEKKFVSGWEESSCMNSMFNSNEFMPFSIEPNDRRFLVIWPRKKLPRDIAEKILDYSVHPPKMREGVAEAFYHELLNWDMDPDFDASTEPPMTKAKEEIIDFGRASWDTFLREWEAERLDVPFIPCLSEHLYRLYKWWCGRFGEHAMGNQKFLQLVAKKLDRRRDLRYVIGDVEKKGTFILPIPIPSQVKQSEWLGDCASDFKKKALSAMGDGDYPSG